MKPACETVERHTAPSQPDAAQQAAATLRDTVDAIECFQQQQQRRVLAYRQLTDAHSVVLRTGDLFTYQKRVQVITTEFSDCSAQIMAISEHLRGRLGADKASAILDKLQCMEEQKLQLTIALHAAKAHAPLAARDILVPLRDIDEETDIKIAAARSEFKSLTMNLGAVTGAINEQLEELRFLKEDEKERQSV